MTIFRFSILLILMFIYITPVSAETFIIKDIEVQGLERLSADTVFTYIPVDVGDRFDTKQSPDVIKNLYQSGFFDRVLVGVDDDVLIVKIKERSAISSVDIEGNEEVKTDDLREAFDAAGVSSGRVFNPAALDRLQTELKQLYLSRGKYNARVDIVTEQEDDNRVALTVNISEGIVSRIKDVNIVGNEQFTEKDLKGDFRSGLPSWWAFLSSRDEYSKPKLDGDLEILRSHYLDKGYLSFAVDSKQVTLSPDKKDIYIAININEGDQYSIVDIKLDGELYPNKETLESYITFENGEIFSRSEVSSTVEAMRKSLMDEGFAFAKIDVIPDVDDEQKTVGLLFNVDPGEKVYIRRIEMVGNNISHDDVIRRELRLHEGELFSQEKLNLSRRRLRRLAFLSQSNIQMNRVDGVSNQVDLLISLEERFNNNIQFSIGYSDSDSDSVILAGSYQQNNFLGTGKDVGIELNTSSSDRKYSLSYKDPYFTSDGVQLGFDIFYSETDASETNTSDYLLDSYGAGLTYGIPLSENDNLSLKLSYESTKVTTTTNTVSEIKRFLYGDDEIEGTADDAVSGNGDEYDNFLLNIRYAHDTRDTVIFPTSGNLQRLELESSIPSSDLEYYKAEYTGNLYLPISTYLTGVLKASVAYGNAYGDTTELPFFEKFYAGGVSTVRGYESNSLGPTSSSGDPLGGIFRTTASAALVFPPPFDLESDSMRFGLFVDAGNVFQDTSGVNGFDEDELRSSAGISLIWITGLGPLTFSNAYPLNDKAGDDLQKFQFTIGASF